MKKRLLAWVLSFALALSLLPMGALAAEETRSWQEAYREYIQSDLEDTAGSGYLDGAKEITRYFLFDVNEDSVPELWIDYSTGAYGKRLCSYANGQVQVQNVAYGGLSYIPGQSLAFTSGGHMGYFWDTVYRLENGRFIVVEEGLIRIVDDHGHEVSENEYRYTWNNQDVDKSTYESKLDAAFDSLQAVNSPQDGGQTYQEILETLDISKIPAETLYKEILDKYKRGFDENWSIQEFAENNLCYVCGYAPKELGYIFMDLDGNGVKELLIGSTSSVSDYRGIIYDIYTYSNEIIQVSSFGERYRHFLCDDNIILIDGSSSALNSERDYYYLAGTTLTLKERVVYDAYKNKDNPYFYGTTENYEDLVSITEEKAKEINDSYVTKSIDYISFGEYDPDASGDEDIAKIFSDVSKKDWFYDAVCYVYENKMMNGVAENIFAPNTAISRAMIVTILYRLENEPAVDGSAFEDVPSGQWYTDAVAWAATNGIVNGVTETTFAPNSPITREQMAVILYRYAAWKGRDVSAQANLSGYSDATAISAYAVHAMAWANAEGLITGVTDTTLCPGDFVVRAQAAAILMRLYGAEQLTLTLRAGPGEDYASLGNIQAKEIDEYILEEGNWIEVDYGRGYAYVQENSLGDFDKSNLPYVSQEIVVGPTRRPYVVYYDNLSLTLTDKVDVYSGVNSSFAIRDTLEVGDTVSVLREIKGDNVADSTNPFVLIDYNGLNGKSRGYALRKSLLDVDNPLRGFDEVKRNNAAFTYNGETYYSTSAYPNALDGWQSVYSESLTQIRFNVLNAVTGAIASNGGDALLENETWLYDAKANAVVKTNTSSASKAVFDTTVDIFGMINAALVSGNESIALYVDLESYGNEGRMLIRGGTPFETPKAGKTNLSLASLIAQSSALNATMSSKKADEMIRMLCPEITGNEKCSMQMTFSDDFSDNPYGYYYIVGANGEVYAQVIIHPGTQFLVYQGGKLVGDLAPRLTGMMMKVNDETASRVLEVLAENGIRIK